MQILIFISTACLSLFFLIRIGFVEACIEQSADPRKMNRYQKQNWIHAEKQLYFNQTLRMLWLLVFMVHILSVFFVLQLTEFSISKELYTRDVVLPIGVMSIDFLILFLFGTMFPKIWIRNRRITSNSVMSLLIIQLIEHNFIHYFMRKFAHIIEIVTFQKSSLHSENESNSEMKQGAQDHSNNEMEQDETETMLASIIDFKDTIVREVMIPRLDMICVSQLFSADATLECMLKEGLSRVPVIGERDDDIVGVVYAKDIMQAIREHENQIALEDVLRKAQFVPETKKIAKVLQDMQVHHYHLALVVDEYGAISGLVTLEDILEELVGEIIDEFDADELFIEPLAGGAFRIKSRVSIDDVNKQLKTEFPSGDWDSLGGFFLNHLGRIPIEGETFSFQGWWVRAEQVQRRRIGYIWLAPQE